MRTPLLWTLSVERWTLDVLGFGRGETSNVQHPTFNVELESRGARTP